MLSILKAVYHNYVKKWLDWPYSNADSYLQSMGYEKAERIWKAYPLYDYGLDWDPPDLWLRWSTAFRR